MKVVEVPEKDLAGRIDSLSKLLAFLEQHYVGDLLASDAFGAFLHSNYQDYINRNESKILL